MPIDSQNLARLLEFLHRLDATTIKEVIAIAETVLGEKERQPTSSVQASPALTDDSPMPFGKFRGKPLRQVDESYFRWLWGQRPIKASPALESYIQNRFYPNEPASSE